MLQPLIEIIDAKKSYLDHTFNLKIHAGDFIIIKGGNGSGKTTLIHLILGFTKPDKGCVKRRISRINYCPEKAYLPPHLAVYEYIEMMSAFRGVDVDMDLIHLLKIPLYKKIANCSKGNMQKVCLYQALTGKSDLYILDEPFSGLDKDISKDLCVYLKMLSDQAVTVIVSTHQPQLLEHIKTDVIAL